jgi:16S rRNA (cytosine1402-N4)-methyltransferase
MTEPDPDKPPRRERYRGTNPRGFQQKYKEQQPGKYPLDIAKVLAGGRTPAGSHRPIMVREILEVLDPKPGDFAVDCTLGYGGHATALLSAIQPHGHFLGLDADPIELPKTEARLRSLGYPDESIALRRTNFAGLSQILAMDSPGGVQIILADLGLSSMQIDDPSRGFSFKTDGPLDMRMNPLRGRSASKLLTALEPGSLALLLEIHSDEPNAMRIAKAILDAHARSPIDSTFALAKIIRSSVTSQHQLKKDESTDTVRRVFQALRIEVNDEFSVLDALLKQIPGCLVPGGRVAIMTFHSGEDRRVKHAFKQGLLSGSYAKISEEIIRPSMQEQRANPRSSSAKLRFAVKRSDASLL